MNLISNYKNKKGLLITPVDLLSVVITILIWILAYFFITIWFSDVGNQSGDVFIMMSQEDATLYSAQIQNTISSMPIHPSVHQQMRSNCNNLYVDKPLHTYFLEQHCQNRILLNNALIEGVRESIREEFEGDFLFESYLSRIFEEKNFGLSSFSLQCRVLGRVDINNIEQEVFTNLAIGNLMIVLPSFQNPIFEYFEICTDVEVREN